MNREAVKEQFFEFAADWICDSYSLVINYLATRDQGSLKILDTTLFLYPLRLEKIVSFAIEAGTLLAGQEILPSLTKADILQRLAKAAAGELDVNGLRLGLDTNAELNYYSEIPNRDTWFSDLHMLISGSQLNSASMSEAIGNDSALGSANPPFDGMADLCAYLQLSDTRASGRATSITIRVNPPVDMVFNASRVHQNTFQLTFSAHPKFDISKIGIATREFPGNGIATRKQSSNLIAWKRAKDGRRPGVLDLELTNANSVFAMLSVNGRTVRRQWFNDPDKAVNTRYVATQLFDKDLNKLKVSVLEATDAKRFEQGIASLLFLLGFSPAIQVETEAPDILLATPGGKLAIVECTMRISDFQNKLGKLVERKNALIKSLESTGHNLRVDAFLVCGLPKAQIAAEDRQLTMHQVTLFTREDIEQAFSQLRTPPSPDEMLDRAAAKLSESANAFGQMNLNPIPAGVNRSA